MSEQTESSEPRTDRIDYYNCQDCRLSELASAEAKLHEKSADHTVVPVYV